MKSSSRNFGIDTHRAYQVRSREEMVTLLRTLVEKNQLVKMLIDDEDEVFVTSILKVDTGNDTLVIDSLMDEEINRRIAAAKILAFETTLDKIRIIFSTQNSIACIQDGRPALRIGLPTNFVRLQRREFYRAPIVEPVFCLVPLPEDIGEGAYQLSLSDISSNGLAMLDEKKMLDNTVGRDYANCQIDLPGVGIITTTLQIRNSYDLNSLNGKTKRRLGCKFINLSKSMLADVQRYIIKLEREKNAHSSASSASSAFSANGVLS